jgi:hypothetical protein
MPILKPGFCFHLFSGLGVVYRSLIPGNLQGIVQIPVIFARLVQLISKQARRSAVRTIHEEKCNGTKNGHDYKIKLSHESSFGNTGAIASKIFPIGFRLSGRMLNPPTVGVSGVGSGG